MASKHEPSSLQSPPPYYILEMLCKCLMIITRVRLQRMASCLPKLYCPPLRILPIEPDRVKRLSLRIISLVAATLLKSQDAGKSGAVQRFPGQEASSDSMVTLLVHPAPSSLHGLAYVGMTNVHTPGSTYGPPTSMGPQGCDSCIHVSYRERAHPRSAACVRRLLVAPPTATGRILQLGLMIL